MSFNIKMPDSTFTHVCGIIPAVAEGLVGVGLCGNNVGVNLFGDTEASAGGTITRVSDLVSLLGVNKYVETNIKVTPDLTFIAVGKYYLPASGDNNLVIGDNLNAKADGTVINSVGILLTTTQAIGVVGVRNKTTGANTTYNASGVLGLPTGSANAAWKCVALRVGVEGISGRTESVSLENITDNVKAVRSTLDTATFERQTDLTKTIKFGSMTDSTTQNNDFQELGYLIYDRALNDTELAAAYAQLKAIAATQGISV
jgi:hypothetical protein